jgi:hypothetical protein
LYGVLHRVKEERNVIHEVTRRKVDRIGHILHRNDNDSKTKKKKKYSQKKPVTVPPSLQKYHTDWPGIESENIHYLAA